MNTEHAQSVEMIEVVYLNYGRVVRVEYRHHDNSEALCLTLTRVDADRVQQFRPSSVSVAGENRTVCVCNIQEERLRSVFSWAAADESRVRPLFPRARIVDYGHPSPSVAE